MEASPAWAGEDNVRFLGHEVAPQCAHMCGSSKPTPAEEGRVAPHWIFLG